MVGRKKDKKDRKGNGQAVPAEPKRLTPVDIQQKEFRVAMRGYHEQDVDRFLDEVTEELARLYADNKRLREQLELTGTARLDVGAAAEADAILQRAREQAERILAEARAATGGYTSPPSFSGPSVLGTQADIGPFISRERDFLQSLANLIQSHAEAVKQDLRKTREPSRPAMPPPMPEPGPSPATGPDLIQGGAASAPGKQDDVVDLTQADADQRVPHGVDDDDDEDRSIRELFWGED